MVDICFRLSVPRTEFVFPRLGCLTNPLSYNTLLRNDIYVTVYSRLDSFCYPNSRPSKKTNNQTKITQKSDLQTIFIYLVYCLFAAEHVVSCSFYRPLVLS